MIVKLSQEVNRVMIIKPQKPEKPERPTLAYYLSLVRHFWGAKKNEMRNGALSQSSRKVVSQNGKSGENAEIEQQWLQLKIFLKKYKRLLIAGAVLLLLCLLLLSGIVRCSRNHSAKPASAPVVTATETALPPMTPEQLHAAYPQNLVVIGDSIASGYHLYGFIPEEHGLATGNAAIRSLHDYTYSCDGQENMDVTEIIGKMQPGYILMSMGMNDINLLSEEEFTSTYQTEIEGLLAVSPESNIAVAAITPIEYGNSFVAASKIVAYNSALQQMIEEMQRENVKYFDAFSLLADSSTQSLKSEYSAGDGIHLATASYEAMLSALYPILDTMPFPTGHIVTAAAASAATAETTSTETTATEGTT